MRGPRAGRRLLGLAPGLFLAAAVLSVISTARGDADDQTPVFVLRTEEEARRVVELHATSGSEVLYTTVSFTHKGFYAGHMADFAAHLWQSLREIQRMENTFVVSYDLHTCQAIMQRGIPCFLDRWSLQPSQLPGQYGKEVPHWYSKYSWGLKLLEWGYTAVFVEMDMVFSSDPLPYFKKNLYDLEGLSDWRLAEVPDPKVRFTDTCNVYHVIKKDNGHQTLDWGPSDPNDPRQTKHVNPCMSTGFWFLQPTEASKKFLRDFIQLAVYELTEEVDQIVWNEAIMAFLIGTAKYNPPLRIGLLDEERFSNFEVYNWRVEQGLPTNPVMLHCGALSPSDKWPMMNQLGFWKAGWWDPTVTEEFMTKISQHLPRGLPHGQPQPIRHQLNVEHDLLLTAGDHDNLLRDFDNFAGLQHHQHGRALAIQWSHQLAWRILQNLRDVYHFRHGCAWKPLRACLLPLAVVEHCPQHSIEAKSQHMDELLNLPCTNPANFSQQSRPKPGVLLKHEASTMRPYISLGDRTEAPEDQVIRPERTSLLVRKFVEMGLRRASEAGKRQSTATPEGRKRPQKLQRGEEEQNDEQMT